MTNKYLKMYGASRHPNPPEIVAHDDFSLIADANTLRRLAEFLIVCADALEVEGDQADVHWHRHFRDFSEDWTEGMCDLIVTVNS